MVSDNSPALGWVRVTDAVVTYNNTIYVLPPDATVKKYVYWEAEHPDRFNYSDVILPDSATRYLVLINDNGQHTVVHSKTDNFNIAFDKGVQSAIEKKLYGMYEEFKDEMGANETKFSNIVQTIDSIKLTVGEMKSTDTILEERYTTLLETVNGLGVEVREKITTADTQNKLREDAIKSFVDIMTNLGVFETLMRSIMADDKLDFNPDENEREQITTTLSQLEKMKNSVIASLENVANDEKIREKNPQKAEAIKTSSAEELNSKYSNLKSIVESAMSDRSFNATDKKLIYESIAGFISSLNAQKTSVNELLVLGFGGSVIENIGKMFTNVKDGGFSYRELLDGMERKSAELSVGLENITSTVRDTVNTLNTVQSTVEQTAREITTKVSDSTFSSTVTQLKNSISSKVSASDVYSIIKQNPDSLEYYFNENRTATLEIGGLTIHNGYVATDNLRVPEGHFPYLALFDRSKHSISQDGARFKPAIDCTAEYNTGYGGAIRLKANDKNYLYVSDNAFSYYRDGNEIFRISQNYFNYNNQESGVYQGTNYVNTQLLDLSGRNFHFKTRTFNESTRSYDVVDLLVDRGGVYFNGNRLATGGGNGYLSSDSNRLYISGYQVLDRSRTSRGDDAIRIGWDEQNFLRITKNGMTWSRNGVETTVLTF